jgi:hypothetical protein
MPKQALFGILMLKPQIILNIAQVNPKFTCFTSTKVQILTPVKKPYLLLYYLDRYSALLVQKYKY